MERQWNRALIVTLIMILSSMAGCLDNTDDITDEPVPIVIIEDSNNTTTPMPFGNVMVSTYHVGELVSAVAGEHVTINYMSQDNIPVHDYEPTVEDIIRLQNSDLFFYHGLNLEPWVESTLSSLGDDAPPSFMTHAMSTGQITLDYESLLVSNLCEVMNEGPFEATTLGMMPEDHHEDHDDHDDHNETGDHDDHNETGDHDEHDEHEGHEHAAVEKTISDPEACPADTNIHIFHMEEGEHVLEFESEHDESFNMVALKMLGGHAHHHHHDHGDHGAEAFEWAGVFAMNDATHTWSMQKVGGDYADQTMRLVLIPTDTPTEENMHELEAGVEALIEGDSCTIVEDGETMSSIAATGSCFELHVGTGDDSTFTMDTTGITGMAMYAQHVPTEFERDQHYLKDSTGTDIEPIAQEGAGAHDHGDHGDETEGEINADDDQDFKYDPHSWLDPLSFAAQVDVVLEKLILTFPNGTSNFTENANSYKAQLQTLDNDFVAAFGDSGTCSVGDHDKTIVANHNAYSYMSERYDIEIVTVNGLDPEGEPSAQDIVNVINHIKENEITVLFVEEYTNENAVNSIVEDTGVSIEKLYTMEMAPIDTNDNYLSLMNKNLNNLVNGIGC